MNKYGNKKVVYNDFKFDSQMEADYYRKYLEGCDVKVHPKYELIAGITYVADFELMVDGKTTVIDIKGFETKDFVIKRKLFEFITKLKLQVITQTPSYLREWHGDYINMDTLKDIEKVVKKWKKKMGIKRISKELLTVELIEQIKAVG